MHTKKSTNELLFDLAQKLDGYSWGTSTPQAFTPKAWKQRRIDKWTPHFQHQSAVLVEDVFDYIHRFADGSSEGNTTSEIIARMRESK